MWRTVGQRAPDHESYKYSNTTRGYEGEDNVKERGSPNDKLQMRTEPVRS